MGTHPIFESDFDCLTEMSSPEPIPPINNIPNQSDVTVSQSKSFLSNMPDSIATAGMGAGAALGAGLVAAIGKGSTLAMRGIATYARRNYMTKLEVANTDLSYNWML